MLLVLLTMGISAKCWLITTLKCAEDVLSPAHLGLVPCKVMILLAYCAEQSHELLVLPLICAVKEAVDADQDLATLKLEYPLSRYARQQACVGGTSHC